MNHSLSFETIIAGDAKSNKTAEKVSGRIKA
jgi:hypothetical protein